jgi:plastocyanin
MRLLVLAACAAAWVGCGSDGGYGSGDPAPAPAACSAATATAVTGPITLVGLAFVPSCGKVAAGTEVTFTNGEAELHTVTSDAGAADFDSGTLTVGDSFTTTFPAARTVQAHCGFHPTMRLTLFVE